jgi:hypothetical protein
MLREEFRNRFGIRGEWAFTIANYAPVGRRAFARWLRAYAVIALAIALDRAEHVEQPVQLLGWL